MYIHRVILKDVPGLPDRDLTFFDEWTGKPIDSVLITGPNGTGKTTILNIIANLWNNLGHYIEGFDSFSRDYRGNVDEAFLLAIELRGFAGKNLWLYFSDDHAKAEQFLAKLTDGNINLVGEFKFGGSMSWSMAEAQSNADFKYIRVTSKLYFQGNDDIRELQPLWEKLQIGVQTSHQMLPNMVLIRADERQFNIVSDARDESKRLAPEALYSWSVQYSNDPRLNVEGLLRNLKIRDPQWFQNTLNHINLFLEQNGKHLTDFDAFLRLRIETGKEESERHYHYIENLSSGEQQCLLLIFMVSRWLMPGGVVLIDEPDLHIHVSWQRQLLHVLEQLVREKNGQLIVTSHSPTLWEEYSQNQRFNLEMEPQRDRLD